MTRSDEIRENIEKWKSRLKGVDICAVTKTMPVDDINAAIDAGITDIGENRVQELLSKLDGIKSGANIHIIGRLQTNKVKQIIGKVNLIQSLDRDELALEISKRSKQMNAITNVLVEVSIAGEAQKGGVPADEVFGFIEKCAGYPNICIKGLMAVMPLNDDVESLRPYFKKMRRMFEEIKRSALNGASMDILSMGMSNDCVIAAEEGATMVRIGRGIFGTRL